ncbi:MAG: hypothetical protein GC146_02870 [Limimaricola sp.]|uniref:capsular polysaccharide export protein, LipB/KpsS family n=1 Tax=Limimaricola sp. TaxID=2211665 RepID=UPI001DC40D06|nr:hypothetical protein [Limimaricola sp.]MBI1416142.1 hypothetical protein [Limimaricola sp.]
MPGEILIHLPRHMLANVRDNPSQFYAKLRDGLNARGARASLVERAAMNAAPAADDGDFHFIHQMVLRQPNVLCTGLAYVYPFWYADPSGIYGDSSLAEAEFDPREADAEEARVFHVRLHRRLVEGRMSRYGQKQEPEVLPEGCVAVFLQGGSDILDRVQHVTTPEMVAAVLDGAGDRAVVIKPHPKENGPEVMAWLADIAARDRRVMISDANIHDILAVASVSVSISSAVALEGMIHHTPAILFGRSDLRHCAITLKTPAGFDKALEMATQIDWPFEAFLYWFLGQNTINAGTPELVDQAIARIAAQGADMGRLGLGRRPGLLRGAARRPTSSAG